MRLPELRTVGASSASIAATSGYRFLARAPRREDDAPIECGSPTFAAAARSDSNGIGDAFDDVAEADVLSRDESRETHPVRLGFVLVGVVGARVLVFHRHHTSNILRGDFRFPLPKNRTILHPYTPAATGILVALQPDCMDDLPAAGGKTIGTISALLARAVALAPGPEGGVNRRSGIRPDENGPTMPRAPRPANDAQRTS